MDKYKLEHWTNINFKDYDFSFFNFNVKEEHVALCNVFSLKNITIIGENYHLWMWSITVILMLLVSFGIFWNSGGSSDPDDDPDKKNKKAKKRWTFFNKLLFF